MSVKRRDLINHFEINGFYLLREGGKHSIYTNDIKTIPFFTDINHEIGTELVQTEILVQRIRESTDWCVRCFKS